MERLTKKRNHGLSGYMHVDDEITNTARYRMQEDDCYDKLGKLEDLMEKYDIKDLTELERIIINNGTGEQAFKDFCEQNVKPYKDIEQELGIGLSVLIKAMFNGIFAKFGEKIIEIKPSENEHLVFDYNDQDSTNFALLVYERINKPEWIYDWWITDYGKTWALTKEELK